MRKETILIVDDSRTILEVLNELIMQNGFETVKAMNGIEALDVLKSRHVDMIVLDIEMPVMNGFQLCRLIRKDPNFKDIPIMLLTTRPAEIDKNRIWGFKAGANAYINKDPFDENAIIETINQLLKSDANKN